MFRRSGVLVMLLCLSIPMVALAQDAGVPPSATDSAGPPSTASPSSDIDALVGPAPTPAEIKGGITKVLRDGKAALIDWRLPMVMGAISSILALLIGLLRWYGRALRNPDVKRTLTRRFGAFLCDEDVVTLGLIGLGLLLGLTTLLAGGATPTAALAAMTGPGTIAAYHSGYKVWKSLAKRYWAKHSDAGDSG